MRVAVALIALATVAAVPLGPTAAEFGKLRTAKGEKCPPLRNLSCTTLGDPSELKCAYEEQFKGKPWTKSVALVGRDGKGWTWLDGGPRCSPLPQQ